MRSQKCNLQRLSNISVFLTKEIVVPIPRICFVNRYDDRVLPAKSADAGRALETADKCETARSFLYFDPHPRPSLIRYQGVGRWPMISGRVIPKAKSEKIDEGP